MAAKPTNGSDIKEEHRRLTNVVKGVHAGLRRKYKESGDFVQTWHQHCQDAGVLSEYADAMHHLAMDHWTMRPDTRIDWCRSTLLEYFTQGGLAKCMEKDAKRLSLERMAMQKITQGSGDPRANECAECLRKKNCKLANLNGHLIENGHTWNKQYDVVHLPIEGKIRLLDVGSCFNPFVEFEDFLAVGIDICPAKSSVYNSDFLHLETTETLQLAGDTLDTFMSNLKSPIEKLPKDSFHVVVFSLLLEYFPAPYQRWLCCQKARKLLMKNGLLVIITPDSSHQNRNAAMMKSWKTAIESMGFNRWRYVKQEHLHCMAFRKVSQPCNRDRHLVSDASPDMLYIPQDFNDIEEKSGLTPSYTQADEEFFRQTVHELPLGFLEEDLECGV